MLVYNIPTAEHTVYLNNADVGNEK